MREAKQDIPIIVLMNLNQNTFTRAKENKCKATLTGSSITDILTEAGSKELLQVAQHRRHPFSLGKKKADTRNPTQEPGAVA